MEIEVELRAKIKDRARIKARLQSLGAKFLKSNIFFNTYHGHSFFRDKDIQVRVSDSYSMSRKKWERYLGYKGPNQRADANVREEIDEKFGKHQGTSSVLEKIGIKNISLDSTARIREILENNGFPFFMAMIGDNDERFTLGDLAIKLMHLPQLGLELIEVEKVITQRAEIKTAREEVWKFMRRLGLTEKERIEKEPVQLTYSYYFKRKTSLPES